MATVRKLVTKLAFEADTSQADKFERIIIRLKTKVEALNRAMKSKSEDDRRKRINKLATAFKRLREKIDQTKIGKAVKNFGKRIIKATEAFNTAVLPKIRKIAGRIVGVFKGIAEKIKNNKLKIIGAIIAAAAAIKSATLRTAEVETLDVAIIGKFGEEGAKELNKQIEKIKKDLKIGELFSALEIKQGIVTAIQLGVDPKAIGRQIQDALLAAATTPGASFEEAMAAFTTFTFTGDEASLAKFGTFNRDQIEALKIARREASNFTNERKEQILLQANALKRADRLRQLERVLGTTSAKISKTTGEIADSWLRAGNAIKDNVNNQLDNTLELIKSIKNEGLTETFLNFQQTLPSGEKGKSIKENLSSAKGLISDRRTDKETKDPGFLQQRSDVGLLGLILGFKNKQPQTQGQSLSAPSVAPAGISSGGQEITVTQNITVDGNVVDVSRTEQSKMWKALQSAIMVSNQSRFGASANRQ